MTPSLCMWTSCWKGLCVILVCFFLCCLFNTLKVLSVQAIDIDEWYTYIYQYANNTHDTVYADVNLSFVIRIILILTHAHTVVLWVNLASATNIEYINGKQWTMLVQRSWVMMWKSENTMSFGNLLIWKLIEFLVFHEMMNCKKPKIPVHCDFRHSFMLHKTPSPLFFFIEHIHTQTQSNTLQRQNKMKQREWEKEKELLAWQKWNKSH